MDGPAPAPGGPPPEAPDRALDDAHPSVVWTSVGVGLSGAGAALAVIGALPGLRVLGVAVGAAGVAVLAAAPSRPAGTGDEDPAVPAHPGVGPAIGW